MDSAPEIPDWLDLPTPEVPDFPPFDFVPLGEADILEDLPILVFGRIPAILTFEKVDWIKEGF